MLIPCIGLKTFAQSAFATKLEFDLALCSHQDLLRKDKSIERPWLRYWEQVSQKDAQTLLGEDLQTQWGTLASLGNSSWLNLQFLAKTLTWSWSSTTSPLSARASGWTWAPPPSCTRGEPWQRSWRQPLLWSWVLNKVTLGSLRSQYSSVPSPRKATGRKKHQCHSYISFGVHLFIPPLRSICLWVHFTLFFPSENLH